MKPEFKPVFKQTYDLSTLESQVKDLLAELLPLFYKKTDRQTIVEQNKPRLIIKYNYLYTNLESLFDMAIEYYVLKKSIAEFREIFAQYTCHIRKLQQDPDSYGTTSQHIGKFISKKYLPKDTPT